MSRATSLLFVIASLAVMFAADPADLVRAAAEVWPHFSGCNVRLNQCIYPIAGEHFFGRSKAHQPPFFISQRSSRLPSSAKPTIVHLCRLSYVADSKENRLGDLANSHFSSGT